MIDRRRLLAASLALPVAGASAQAWAQAPFASRNIVVRTRGSGPDVVLIPGLGSTSVVWDEVAARLPGRRLHLISLKGFGDLRPETDPDRGVMAPAVSEITRYIDQADLRDAAVVGHSMGGQIGLWLTADRPRSVGRLMTVDSSPFFPALISPGATVGDVRPIAELAYQLLSYLGDDALLSSTGRSLGLDLSGAAGGVFGGIGLQGGDRQVLARAAYEVMTVDLRNRLPAIQAPVTVVYGWSADENAARHQTDRMFRSAYAALPRPATFERIEGADHMVMTDRPAAFMAAMNRFLD